MVIGKFLSELPEGSKNRYAMVGFRVGNTCLLYTSVTYDVLTQSNPKKAKVAYQVDFGHLWTLDSMRCV